MNKIISFSIVMLLLTGGPALASVVSTFDGTDLDGWSASPAIGFTLTNPGSGGNTGGSNDGYAQLTDTSPGGSGGLAVAPLKFLGNLTGYASISWDAWLPAGMFTNEQVSLLVSSNLTEWVYTPPESLNPGVWESRTVMLDGGFGWSRTLGSEPFAQVLASVTTLAFDLEVSSLTGLEAGLDNVRLNPVPVPAALWLFGSGLLGLIGIARRRQM